MKYRNQNHLMATDGSKRFGRRVKIVRRGIALKVCFEIRNITLNRWGGCYAEIAMIKLSPVSFFYGAHNVCEESRQVFENTNGQKLAIKEYASAHRKFGKDVSVSVTGSGVVMYVVFANACG